jgi:hypothetical protein
MQSLYLFGKPYTVVSFCRSHIVSTLGSQIAMRLWASGTNRALLSRNTILLFLVLIFLRRWEMPGRSTVARIREIDKNELSHN